MKRFLLCLLALFISTATVAHTINWYVDGNVYDTTTCEFGDDIILPNPPEKYGYTFQGWRETVMFLEYIDSSGKNYIDTKIPLFNYPSIETKFQMLEKCDCDWFGTGDNILNWNFNSINNVTYIRYGSTAYSKIVYMSDYSVSDFNFFDQAHTLKIVFVSYRPNVYIDDSYVAFMTDLNMDFSVSSATIHISAARTPSLARWYGFKIFGNNGNMLFDGRPAIDKNNIAGMYDMVTGKMFYPSGPGEFVPGPVKR